MANLFSDDFESEAPAPKLEAPKTTAPKADTPSTDFFSTETKVRAKEVTEMARAKTQATVEGVTKRAGETLAQVKERASNVMRPKFTFPSIPKKAMRASGALAVLAIGAGFWFTRAPAPNAPTPPPVTVETSTPTPAQAVAKKAAPQPSTTASVPVALVAVAPVPIKSPTAQEISARWAKNTQPIKPASKTPAADVHPQYEADADAALNAWKKSH